MAQIEQQMIINEFFSAKLDRQGLRDTDKPRNPVHKVQQNGLVGGVGAAFRQPAQNRVADLHDHLDLGNRRGNPVQPGLSELVAVTGGELDQIFTNL